MSAAKDPERTNAAAMDRGRPAQFRSSGTVEFTVELSVAQGRVGTQKRVPGQVPEPAWGGDPGSRRKYLQNDELIEYAFCHSDLFYPWLVSNESQQESDRLEVRTSEELRNILRRPSSAAGGFKGKTRGIHGILGNALGRKLCANGV